MIHPPTRPQRGPPCIQGLLIPLHDERPQSSRQDDSQPSRLLTWKGISCIIALYLASKTKRSALHHHPNTAGQTSDARRGGETDPSEDPGRLPRTLRRFPFLLPQAVKLKSNLLATSVAPHGVRQLGDFYFLSVNLFGLLGGEGGNA